MKLSGLLLQLHNIHHLQIPETTVAGLQHISSLSSLQTLSVYLPSDARGEAFASLEASSLEFPNLTRIELQPTGDDEVGGDGRWNTSIDVLTSVIRALKAPDLEGFHFTSSAVPTSDAVERKQPRVNSGHPTSTCVGGLSTRETGKKCASEVIETVPSPFHHTASSSRRAMHACSTVPTAKSKPN